MRGGDKEDETLCDLCGRRLADPRRLMCDDCRDKVKLIVYGRQEEEEQKINHENLGD